MPLAQATRDRIGQPESELLEYKAVLPPAATIAQLICAFANTKGGAIVLGVVEDGKQILINGLSDEFRAEQITRKAIDLLTPTPAVSYDYVVHQSTPLFVIEVQQSSAEVSLAGKVYVRVGDRTTPKQSLPVKALTDPGIERLSKALAEDRKACTEARAKLLDHYESVLRILDDLAKLLYPKGSSVPADNPEGKMLMRILFASCADTFETFMSDLLYQIYLAKPQVLKSEAPVTVKEVLDCADMQEFITWYAKEKLQKLQRGSVKGFIADNQAIKPLNVFDKARIDEIEKILQIRHLYTHKNGIVDDKFRRYFPATNINDEYRMTLDEFLKCFEYLAVAVQAVDEEAREVFKLALYS
ncbi:MAG TPA: ATP-binding protein [Solibacterales bacterium]|nr:ATP-binding protein [Bryobacterales bacterium]